MQLNERIKQVCGEGATWSLVLGLHYQLFLDIFPDNIICGLGIIF